MLPIDQPAPDFELCDLDGKHPDPAETPPYGCAIVRYAL